MKFNNTDRAILGFAALVVFLVGVGLNNGRKARNADAAAAAEAAQHEQAERAELAGSRDAELPRLVAALDAAQKQLDSGDAVGADKTLVSSQAQARLGRYMWLDPADEQVRKMHSDARVLRGKIDEAIAAEKATADRQRVVASAVETAAAVVADATRCDTAKDVADAWAGLKQVKPIDAQWKQAKALTVKLERCRAKVERGMTQLGRTVAMSQREAMADASAEAAFLAQGIDMRISVSGKYKDQIRFTYVLVSRPWVYQMTHDGTDLLGRLQGLGFKRVTFSDGYNESYWFDLQPTDEALLGSLALAPMGLGQKLVLEGGAK